MPGIETVYKTTGKMPWDINSAAQQPKMPKFVSNFNASSQKTIAQIPKAFNPGSFGIAANGANDQMVAQKQAAQQAAGAGQVGAKRLIGSQSTETINHPQAAPTDFNDGGISGVNQLGKTATAGLEAQLKQQQQAAQQSQGGYDSSGQITGGIPGMDAEQIGNANLIIKEGLKRGLSGDDIQTALMASLAESRLRNLNHGDRDSVGLFQQRTSQGWGTTQQIMDPNYSAGAFYDALGKAARGPNLWNTAQNVQQSAFADGSNYQAQAQKAASLWGAYNQNGGISSAPVPNANSSASWINANNGKYHDYDGMYGAQCVDLYAFYTSGFVGGNPIGVGYAQELWNTYDNRAYVRVAGNQQPRMGDVAIWSNGYNGMGGHVAIVAQDNGNGTVRVLNANATSLGPRGNTVMSNLSKGYLLGYLRPRKLM